MVSPGFGKKKFLLSYRVVLFLISPIKQEGGLHSCCNSVAQVSIRLRRQKQEAYIMDSQEIARRVSFLKLTNKKERLLFHLSWLQLDV